MNTQEVPRPRSFLNRVGLFLKLPMLYVVTFYSADGKAVPTLWSVKKNEGKVMVEAMDIEDKHGMELYGKASISFGKLLKMFIQALFEV